MEYPQTPRQSKIISKPLGVRAAKQGRTKLDMHAFQRINVLETSVHSAHWNPTGSPTEQATCFPVPLSKNSAFAMVGEQ